MRGGGPPVTNGRLGVKEGLGGKKGRGGKKGQKGVISMAS